MSNIQEKIVTDNTPDIRVENTPYLRSRKKRVTDIAIGIFGLLVMTAGLPVIALLIKLDSRGPVFYRQVRLGIDGRPFVLIKFRTMIHRAEEITGPAWSERGDRRITRVGNLLRRTYIDEFPQWWNVIKGDMSVVGPRPERPEMTTTIIQSVSNFRDRLVAKPGITGLAQIKYKYGSNIRDARNKFRLDTIYIDNASPLFDAKILILTFKRIFFSLGT